MARVSYLGEEFEFDAAARLMEPELRQTMLERIAPCSEQELLDAYAAAHLAVYGEEFYVP